MTTLDQAVTLVRARLALNVEVDVFLGEPAARMDSDGRAHPYLAIWPGPSRRDPTEETLCGTPGQPVWRFQITAAGGDPTRAIRAATAAHTQLLGWSPAPDAGFIREDADPGPVQHDTAVNPSRWFFPLQFAVDL